MHIVETLQHEVHEAHGQQQDFEAAALAARHALQTSLANPNMTGSDAALQHL
jgi:hypothetical protein